MPANPKPRFRRLLIFLVLTVAAVGLSGFLAAKYFLPSAREAVQSELSKLLGSKVIVREARLHLFSLSAPFPEILLDGIDIRSKQPASRIAEVGQLQARFALRPLFDKRIEIQKLVFQAPRLNARVENGSLSLAPAEIPGCDSAAATNPPPAASSSGEGSADLSKASPPKVSPPSNWSVTLNTIELRDGELTVATTLSQRQFKFERMFTKVQRTGDEIQLNDPVVEGRFDKTPFTAAAKRISCTNEAARVQIEGGTVSLAGQKLELNGEWNSTGIRRANISFNGLSLEKVLSSLPPEIKPSEIPIIGADLTANMEIAINADFVTNVSGSLRFKRLKPRSAATSIDSLSLEKLSAAVSGGVIERASADLSLTGLKIGGIEHQYAAGSVIGPVEYLSTQKKEQSLKGNLTVKTFEYRNSTTAVTNVDARISNLIAKLDRAGGVFIGGMVAGSSLAVTDPNVTVEKIAEVSAPIEVIIPAAGGYQVNGSVKGSGIFGSVLNRKLSNLSGEVSILISEQLKQFRSKDLAGDFEGKRLKSQIGFSITPSQFELSPSSLTFVKAAGGGDIGGGNGGDGTIRSSFVLARDKQQSGSAEVSVLNLSTTDLAVLLPPQTLGSTGGQIVLLQCSVKGQLASPSESVTATGKIEFLRGGPASERFSQKIVRAIELIPLAGTVLRSNDDDSKVETAQQRIKADFSIADQRVHSDNVEAIEPSYTLTAAGDLTFSGEIRATAQAVFLQESFADYGFGFKKLGALLGKAGRIKIPLTISGPATDATVRPDLIELAKNNSGLPLVRSAVGTTLDFGGKLVKGVDGIIRAPFK